MMLIYPDVQKKAQDELNKVIQHGSTPEFGDRDALSYLVCNFILLTKPGANLAVQDAAWRESQRYNPSTPLGIVHTASEADIYKGMYIPKGTFEITNIG